MSKFEFVWRIVLEIIYVFAFVITLVFMQDGTYNFSLLIKVILIFCYIVGIIYEGIRVYNNVKQLYDEKHKGGTL